MIIEVNAEGISEGHYRGLVPILSLPPNADLIRGRAGAILELTQGTVDDIQPVFATWKEIDGNYVSYDSNEVLTALDQDARDLSAIMEAGRVIAGALTLYADYCDGYHERHLAYGEEVIVLLGYDEELEALTGGVESKAFETDRGTELHSLITSMQPGLKMEGRDLQVGLDDAQQKLVLAMDGLDLSVLDRFTFTSRQAGLDAAQTPEELELMLLESDAFGGDLTLEQIRSLASTIDIDDLPFDYEDAEGRKWVTMADGTKVRAGSAMDPNLNLAIITEMANDPQMSEIKLPAGVDENGEEQYVTTQDVVTAVVGAGNDAGGVGPHMGSLGKALGALGLMQSVGGWSDAGQQGRDTEQALAPLMSDEDLDQIEDHYVNKAVAKTGVSTVLSLPIDAAATWAAPWSGGSSYVVAYVVTDAKDKVVDVVIEKVIDDTWTEKELERKGDDVTDVDTFDQEEYERLVAERIKEEGVPVEEPVGPVNPNAPADQWIQGVPGATPATAAATQGSPESNG